MKSLLTRRTFVRRASTLIGSAGILGLNACSNEENSSSRTQPEQNVNNQPQANNRPDTAVVNQSPASQNNASANTDQNATSPGNPTDNVDDSDPLISESHPAAAALNYSHEADTVDPQVRVEKSGVPGAEQYCDNCQFYQAVEGEQYGSCQLIPVAGKHVADKGWCVSWTVMV